MVTDVNIESSEAEDCQRNGKSNNGSNKRPSLYLTIVQIVHLSALPSEVVGKT